MIDDEKPKFVVKATISQDPASGIDGAPKSLSTLLRNRPEALCLKQFGVRPKKKEFGKLARFRKQVCTLDSREITKLSFRNFKAKRISSRTKRAERAEKPLYRVTCGDIGTDAEATETVCHPFQFAICGS